MCSYSIVIPTYKRHEELYRCLQCLSPYFRDPSALQIQLIVSDDARDSSLRSVLMMRFPWVRYTEGPARGPAANRNHGAKLASGEWIAFTDDDCLPQLGWIEAFAHYAHSFDVLEGKTSAVGVRSRLDEECPVNENGGYLFSCNFAIRRELFISLHGFNEGFPGPAVEDLEFRDRLLKANSTICFVPEALVLHQWRLRKGFGYAFMHSWSVSHYLHLHPEKARHYTFSSQARKVLYAFLVAYRFCIANPYPKGVIRSICLDVYSHFLVLIFFSIHPGLLRSFASKLNET